MFLSNNNYKRIAQFFHSLVQNQKNVFKTLIFIQKVKNHLLQFFFKVKIVVILPHQLKQLDYSLVLFNY